MAPNEMKAPPSKASTNTVARSAAAFLTPTCSARSAMVAGMIASNITS